MDEQLEWPPAGISQSQRRRGGLGERSLATPSKVLPTSKGTVKNDRARKIQDDTGDVTSNDVIDAGDSSEVKLDQDIFDVHEDLVLGDIDDTREIEGVPDLNNYVVETHDNDSDNTKSISLVNIIDVGNGDEDPSIAIPDDANNNGIILTSKKNSSGINFIELDRVGQVEDDDNNDDIATIVDKDEDALQELEQMRSEGQGSERESLLNTTGTSSDIMDGIQNDYGFSDEEIELSGDEEEDYHRQDVTMMLIKRPPLTTEPVECYDILDSDEEFPVCLAEGQKTDAINIEEKRGEIKEYINKEGLGIIFSNEFGLVLFHVENVWINGDKYNAPRTQSKLPVGSQVTFYDQTFQREEYEALSSDGLIHQAVAVWVGMRVDHLLKKTSDSAYIKKLEENRKSFMLCLTQEVFMRVDLVRTKARVTGYLTDEVGILEIREGGQTKEVMFHTDNVLLYREPLSSFFEKSRVQNGRCTLNAKQLLPVGLNVSIDARKVSINGVRNVKYQAILVLAGSWPESVHPTLLPGGQGSVFPSFYQVPDNHTFFYFDVELEEKLQRQVYNFHDILDQTRGQIVYDDRNSMFIKGPNDYALWKEQFTGIKPENQNRRNSLDREKEEVGHLFKAPALRPPRVVKEFKEETGSVEGTAGSSCGGSAFSRPYSRLSKSSRSCSGLSMSSRTSGVSQASSQRSTITSRNWYSQVGGLRLKTEVKSEQDEEGPSPPKRIKSTLGLF